MFYVKYPADFVRRCREPPIARAGMPCLKFFRMLHDVLTFVKLLSKQTGFKFWLHVWVGFLLSEISGSLQAADRQGRKYFLTARMSGQMPAAFFSRRVSPLKCTLSLAAILRGTAIIARSRPHARPSIDTNNLLLLKCPTQEEPCKKSK